MSYLALQCFFVALCLSGAAYALVVRRVFDIPALAFFSSCFYFIPGLVGFAGYAEGVVVTAVPLQTGTYVVMILIVIGAVLTMVLSDLTRAVRPIAVCPSDSGLTIVTWCAVLLALIGFALTLATVGQQLFLADKFSLLSALNRWHLLWAAAATVAFVGSVMIRSPAAIVLSLVLLIVNLYIGFRVDLVIAAIAAMTVWLMGSGKSRLAGHWRLGVAAAALGVFFFVLKYVLLALQLMDLELLISQVKNPEAAKFIFLYSEPFIAQGTLNEVIRQDFLATPDHLIGALYVLVPFANELGATSEGFNAIFQPALFSSVTDYGLGNNIWAQMYAVGRLPVVLMFLVAYLAVILLGDSLLRRVPVAFVPIGSVVMTYWAFYIHRNDMLYQLTLTRRFLMIGLAVVLIGLIWGIARRALAELSSRPASGQTDLTIG